jgi:hypothetical protein
MSTKELLVLQIDALNQAELEELYVFVKQFLAERKQEKTQPGFLERLGSVQIDGPEDFAQNIDLYLSGEKQIVPLVH